MAEVRHLANAPIAEALLDFRVKPRDDLDPTNFESLKGMVGDRYVRSRRLYHVWPSVTYPQHASKHVPEDGASVRGIVFEDESSQWVAQFRDEGFTFNMLRPYSRWEELEGEAKRLWAIYTEVARPLSVVRVGTRFINHVAVPLDEDITEYLTAPPQIPGDLPQDTAFFLSTVVFTSNKLTAVLTQHLFRVDPDSMSLTVLIDVDVFREFDHVSLSELDGGLQELFSELRHLKNRAFFQSVTEQALKPYE